MASGGVPAPAELERLTREAGDARAALRLAHLVSHLETPDVIGDEQITH